MAGEDKQKESKSGSDVPYQKKLSSKIIMGEVKINQRLLIEQGKKEMDLYQVVGIATDQKTGESDNGPYVALLGDFQATNLYTGEVLRSSKLYLPKIAEEMVLARMSGQGPDGHGVQFGFVIGFKLDESSATGYVYTMKPLLQPKADDPMQKLLEQVPAPKQLKLLAASKKD